MRKHSRNMYIDGLAKFLAIFVQKYFFTRSIFNQNSDDLNKFLVKLPFWNVYSYIPYLICSQIMTKTNFTKSYKIARVAPSLKGHNAKYNIYLFISNFIEDIKSKQYWNLISAHSAYDKVRDSSHIWLPKGWGNKNGQNLKQNMFSRLKFSADFISRVKNT